MMSIQVFRTLVKTTALREFINLQLLALEAECPKDGRNYQDSIKMIEQKIRRIRFWSMLNRRSIKILDEVRQTLIAFRKELVYQEIELARKRYILPLELEHRCLMSLEHLA